MGRSRAARSAAMASASPHFNGSTWTLVLSFNSRLNWRGVCVRMCQFNEEKVNLGVGEPDCGGGGHTFHCPRRSNNYKNLFRQLQSISVKFFTKNFGLREETPNAEIFSH